MLYVSHWHSLFEPPEANRKGRRSCALSFLRLITEADHSEAAEEVVGRIQVLQDMEGGPGMLGVYVAILRWTSLQTAALRGWLADRMLRPMCTSQVASRIGLGLHTQIVAEAVCVLTQVGLLVEREPQDMVTALRHDHGCRPVAASCPPNGGQLAGSWRPDGGQVAGSCPADGGQLAASRGCDGETLDVETLRRGDSETEKRRDAVPADGSPAGETTQDNPAPAPALSAAAGESAGGAGGGVVDGLLAGPARPAPDAASPSAAPRQSEGPSAGQTGDGGHRTDGRPAPPARPEEAGRAMVTQLPDGSSVVAIEEGQSGQTDAGSGAADDKTSGPSGEDGQNRPQTGRGGGRAGWQVSPAAPALSDSQERQRPPTGPPADGAPVADGGTLRSEEMGRMWGQQVFLSLGLDGREFDGQVASFATAWRAAVLAGLDNEALRDLYRSGVTIARELGRRHDRPRKPGATWWYRIDRRMRKVVGEVQWEEAKSAAAGSAGRDRRTG